MDSHVFYHLMLNQLEGRFGDTNSFRWSGEGWLGTDENRLWLRSEGTLADGRVDDGQHELLYARPISTYFNAISVGAFTKALGMGTLWPNIVALAIIAFVYFAISVMLLPKQEA